jgi:hypothetical protein
LRIFLRQVLNSPIRSTDVRGKLHMLPQTLA